MPSIKRVKYIGITTIYYKEHDKNECLLDVDVSKLDEIGLIELSDISAMEMCLSPAT